MTKLPKVMYKFNAAAAAKWPRSCTTLCDPIDGSPPGSPIPGILQARTLWTQNRKETVFSKNGAGKTGYPHSKEWILTLFYTTHGN